PQPALIELLSLLKKTFDHEKIKWMEKNNLHLTLKFLGDTSPVQVDQVKTVLRETADNFTAFQSGLTGVGFFKRNRQPKVLFINIEKHEVLKQLAAETDARLNELGFEKEQREFNPHLTLGRIKYLKDKLRFYQTMEEYRNSFIQEVKINEVIYYQSILKPAGAEYKSIEKFGLNSF
ncbi:MAG: RNA 2',3'-cyclic phosphodiesterase, partial [Tangfeifania sp.]